MKVKIYLLQRPRVEVDGREISKDLNTKATALILYLAVNKGKAYSRDVLSEIFWPEQAGDKSRSNLRQTLSSIKKTCFNELGNEQSIIFSEKGDCVINEELDVWVDVSEFYERIQSVELIESQERQIEMLQKSIDLYHTCFLEGFYVKGSAAFDEWIMFERETLERILATTCQKLALLYEKQGKLEQSITCLTNLLKTNPLQEEIYRELMELHYKNKDRTKAIAQYQQCVKVLRSELNISPMQETRLLYNKILHENERVEIAEKNKKFLGQCEMICFKENYLVFECEKSMQETLNMLKHKNADSQAVYETAPNPFGTLEYEGICSLLMPFTFDEDTLPEYAKRGLSFLFPQFYTNDRCQRNLPEINLFYTIRLLLEEKAKQRRIVLVFRCFEILDVKTQSLVKFLLGNMRNPRIYLVITYKNREKVKELLVAASNQN